MKHILPILTLILLTAACGGSKNLASDNDGKRNYNDGYMTRRPRAPRLLHRSRVKPQRSPHRLSRLPHIG